MEVGDDLHFDDMFEGDESMSPPQSPSSARRRVSFNDENIPDDNGQAHENRGKVAQPVSPPRATGSGGRALDGIGRARSGSHPNSRPRSVSQVEGEDSNDFAKSLQTRTMQRRSKHRLAPSNFNLLCVLGKGAYGKVVQAQHKWTKEVRIP